VGRVLTAAAGNQMRPTRHPIGGLQQFNRCREDPMIRGWMKRAGWTIAAGALVAVAWPAQGSAAPQQRQNQSQVECRCVDADGTAIDDCTCFRMPSFDMAFAPFAPRPRLGISVDGDQPSTVDAQGARVSSVIEDGPAGEAGLREGDIITRLGGQSLLQPLAPDVEEDFDLDESLPVQRLMSIARGLETGEEVEVEFLRDGQRQTVTVEARDISPRAFAMAFDGDQIRIDAERMRADAERLREQMRGMTDDMRVFQWSPDAPDAPRVRFFGGPLGSSRYGLELIELNEGLGAYFGATRGALVTEVDEDSTLGLRAGDVILRVGDRDVTTPDRVLRLLATYEDGEQITFRIRRNGSEMDVMGRLEG
jgi:hypothetical protein